MSSDDLPGTTGQPDQTALRLGRKRLRVVGLVVALAFASIAIRLVGFVPDSRTAADDDEAPPRLEATALQTRPDITDRHGQLLATDLRVPSVFADPSMIRDLGGTAKALAEALKGVNADVLEVRLRKAKRFAWVKHQITPAEQAKLLQLGLPGVDFRFAQHRVYPAESLASHVVGFVGLDNLGLAGIEQAIDTGKLGEAGKQRAVTLSLDLRVQEIVQSELRHAHRRFRTEGACGLVMDVLSGELLALASLPELDPNRAETATLDQQKNRCSGLSFELGSIFKLLSHAMALDSGKVSIADQFDATDVLRIGRHTIRDDHAKRKWLSVPEIFMYSSNIGTARMTFAAGGAEPFKAFLTKLGLMERLSFEIRAAARPQLPSRWPDITTATASFGHGLATTPLQFAAAVASLVGDGTRVRPTLLRHSPEQAKLRGARVVSPRTVQDLRYLMWLVVNAKGGTGNRAAAEGYLVGGKTGTAEKVKNGVYLRDRVVASFVGVFPIDKPRYVVLVMLDDPRGDAGTHGFRYGGWTAGPIAAEIIARSGPLLGVPPSRLVADDGFEQRLSAIKGAAVTTPRRAENGLAPVGFDR